MSLKILIVKTSSLGDIVHAMPVLDYLKEKYPEAVIDWVVEKGSFGFVKAHPLVDHVLCFDSKVWRSFFSFFKKWKEIRAFFKDLRQNEYDYVYDLQGNSKSAVVTLLARAKKKVGFARRTVHEWPNLLATNRQFDSPPGANILHRNLSIVQASLADTTSWEPKACRLACQDFAPIPKQDGRCRFMLCFASRWENKKLSLAMYRAFLERLAKNERVYVVYGNNQEKLDAEKLIAGLENHVTLLPPMSLPHWQNVMTTMDGVIAVDSVGLHLAGLAGVPTFSFFGPSSMAVFRPLGKWHDGVQGSCPYGEIFDKRCAKLRSCPTGACIKEVSLEEIWTRFLQWRSACQNRCASQPDRLLPES